MITLRSALTRRICVVMACLLMPLLTLPQMPLAADDRSEGAEQRVQQLVEDMWRILIDTEAAEPARIDALAQSIEAGTDTRLLGRLTLGRGWRELTKDQQQRYMQSFPGFITATLAGQMVAASEGVGGSLDEHFQLTGSEQAGDRDTIVHTEINTPQAKALGVDWRFRDREDQLTLIDVLIDGVSLLITKRNEFSAIIEQQSIEALLTEMERVGT